jgi:hypothetical protein
MASLLFIRMIYAQSKTAIHLVFSSTSPGYPAALATGINASVFPNWVFHLVGGILITPYSGAKRQRHVLP